MKVRRVLDLFCGAGGAAMGLHRAWPDAEIVGVDIKPQPRYPFKFVQADAIQYLYFGDIMAPWSTRDADFIWASPMCQLYSKTRAILRGKGLENPGRNQIPSVRNGLRSKGIPYAIENVPGAPLEKPIRLCGTMFGLRVLRHRHFETSFPSAEPLHAKHDGGTNSHRGYSTGAKYVTVGGNNFIRTEGAEAMGIDWMKTRAELSQAIPPAYSQYIAEQFDKAKGVIPVHSHEEKVNKF